MGARTRAEPNVRRLQSYTKHGSCGKSQGPGLSFCSARNGGYSRQFFPGGAKISGVRGNSETFSSDGIRGITKRKLLWWRGQAAGAKSGSRCEFRARVRAYFLVSVWEDVSIFSGSSEAAFMLSRKERMPFPSPCPSSGSFFGPKTNSAIARIMSRCEGCNNPSIMRLLQESAVFVRISSIYKIGQVWGDLRRERRKAQAKTLLHTSWPWRLTSSVPSAIVLKY